MSKFIDNKHLVFIFLFILGVLSSFSLPPYNFFFINFLTFPLLFYILVKHINKDFIIGNSTYGISFPVIINNKNVWGTQFHPEKSSKAGLEIIKNFINI